jgi:hypothetical protein
MVLKSFIAHNINSIHVFMCIVGAVGCLLPLYFQDSYIEDFEISRSLKSQEFYIFCSICFTLTIPLILDQIIEIIIYVRNGRKVRSKSFIKTLIVTDAEKMLFILGVITVPIIVVIPSLQNVAFAYICCLRSQYMLTIGIVITSAGRYNKGFWTTTLLSFSLLLLMLGLLSGAFTTNLYENQTHNNRHITYIFWKYSFYVNVLAGIIFLSVCAHQFVSTFRRIKKNIEKEDIFILTYIVMHFFAFVFVLIVTVQTPNLIKMDRHSLILVSVPFGFYVLFISVLLMRTVKSEMTEAMVSFYKNIFVKSISNHVILIDT